MDCWISATSALVWVIVQIMMKRGVAPLAVSGSKFQIASDFTVSMGPLIGASHNGIHFQEDKDYLWLHY